MLTRAVCAISPETVELREVSVPDIGPTDVLVRTLWSGISTGTERWVITGQFTWTGQKAAKLPLVPGYQKVGTVVGLGVEVSGLETGQWVFATTSEMDDKHVTRAWGGHVEYSVCPQEEVILLPDGFDPKDAASLVLTQVGFNGGSRPPVKKGDRALIIGDGLVGQWLSQTLRHRGAYTVLAGRRDDRLAIAKKVSADETVNVKIAPLSSLIEGDFDIVADSVGTQVSVAEILQCVKHDGHLVLNGYYRTGENLLDILALHDREITVHSPAGWTRDRLEKTLALVASGSLNVSGLVTHEIPVKEVSRAYDLVLNKTEPFLGIVLNWSD